MMIYMMILKGTMIITHIYIQAYVVDIIQFWNLVFRKKDHLVIFDWVARLSR